LYGKSLLSDEKTVRSGSVQMVHFKLPFSASRHYKARNNPLHNQVDELAEDYFA